MVKLLLTPILYGGLLVSPDLTARPNGEDLQGSSHVEAVTTLITVFEVPVARFAAIAT